MKGFENILKFTYGNFNVKLIFTHFFSDLPGLLSVYTALENTPIFLQHFFGIGGILPLPFRTPLLFSQALFWATTVPEIIGNSFFYWIFLQHFHIFLKIFPNICAFRPNELSINTRFLNFIGKCAIEMNFCNCQKILFLKIYQKFPIHFVYRPKARKLNAWFWYFFEKC